MEHLPETERTYLFSHLEQRRDDLAAARARHAEERDALQAQGPGGGEMARGSQDANSLAEIVQATLDRELIEARAITAALARLASGSYGVCEECGLEIPLERLKAYPTATRCLSCQSAKEHANHPGVFRG